jgi:hypothetical protein
MSIAHEQAAVAARPFTETLGVRAFLARNAAQLELTIIHERFDGPRQYPNNSQLSHDATMSCHDIITASTFSAVKPLLPGVVRLDGSHRCSSP